MKEPSDPRPWPEAVQLLEDQTSGLRLARGQLVGLVTELPEDASRAADRLGRFNADSAGVFVNGVALEDYSVRDIRRHIVVSEIEPRLFSGELRYELVPHGYTHDGPINNALDASSALDLLDALEGGLSTTIEERGRSFSGGQRQRLSLARALLAESDVLILVDPTSAVDTHTESRIAARLGDARRGKTTLVVTTSPLMLDAMDVIYVMSDGHVTAQGTHTSLLRESASYRHIVLREES